MAEPVAEPEFKRKKPTPDDFGGPAFWDALLKVGLLSKRCSVCGEECEVVMYPSRKCAPQTKCSRYGRLSCQSAGFFANELIKEPAKFVQYCISYIEQEKGKSKRRAAGICENTEARYRKAIEESMAAYMSQQVQNGAMMLGGEGKVVEIDEMELTVNKNHRGRRPSKKIWVLGMVEVDAPVVDVPEATLRRAVRLHEYQKELELAMEREARSRRRRSSQQRRRRPLQVPAESPFVAVQVPVEVDDLDGEELVVCPTDPADAAEEKRAIDECVATVNAMFDQAKNNRPRKALFFHIKQKNAETLERLIQANVLPGSMIFTDEWAGYNSLNRLGYKHLTVCHKNEFSRFVIEDTKVIRVSTNHIERLWVDVRTTLAFMTLERTKDSLYLESYRQLRFYDEHYNPNLVRLLTDIEAMWPMREARRLEMDAEMEARTGDEAWSESEGE